MFVSWTEYFAKLAAGSLKTSQSCKGAITCIHWNGKCFSKSRGTPPGPHAHGLNRWEVCVMQPLSDVMFCEWRAALRFQTGCTFSIDFPLSGMKVKTDPPALVERPLQNSSPILLY